MVWSAFLAWTWTSSTEAALAGVPGRHGKMELRFPSTAANPFMSSVRNPSFKPDAGPGQDRAWQACREYAWMNPEAWASLEPHYTDMRPWLISSAGDPTHGRLLIHSLSHRLQRVLEALFAAGANARAQPYGPDEQSTFMPLFYAVSASEHAYRPEILDLLLQHGADPYEPSNSGIATRSVMAGAIDDPVALADLIRRGWDVDMVPVVAGEPIAMVNETALQIASLGYFDKHTPRFRRRQSVRLLLEHAADTERLNQFGQTPLLLAIINQPEIVSLLLNYGARRDVFDREGRGIHDAVDQLSAQDNMALGHSMRRRLAQLECADLEQATAPAQAHRGPSRL